MSKKFKLRKYVKANICQDNKNKLVSIDMSFSFALACYLQQPESFLVSSKMAKSSWRISKENGLNVGRTPKTGQRGMQELFLET